MAKNRFINYEAVDCIDSRCTFRFRYDATRSRLSLKEFDKIEKLVRDSSNLKKML